jgi:hypothetical protein
VTWAAAERGAIKNNEQMANAAEIRGTECRIALSEATYAPRYHRTSHDTFHKARIRLRKYPTLNPEIELVAHRGWTL